MTYSLGISGGAPHVRGCANCCANRFGVPTSLGAAFNRSTTRTVRLRDIDGKNVVRDRPALLDLTTWISLDRRVGPYGVLPTFVAVWGATLADCAPEIMTTRMTRSLACLRDLQGSQRRKSKRFDNRATLGERCVAIDLLRQTRGCEFEREASNSAGSLDPSVATPNYLSCSVEAVVVGAIAIGGRSGYRAT